MKYLGHKHYYFGKKWRCPKIIIMVNDNSLKALFLFQKLMKSVACLF